MSKKRKEKQEEPKTLEFALRDIVRKSINWHLKEASDLQAQLEPHLTKRGFIGCTNNEKTYVCLMFKGTIKDLFKVKEFIEKEDEIDS
jgi:hypothetical protein